MNSAQVTLSWVGRQPMTNGVRLRILRVGIKDFQIFLSRFGCVVKLLGEKIAQSEVRSTLAGMRSNELFELVRGINGKIRLPKREREVIAGIERFWSQG